MKKEKGDIDSAAEILCELQVETFGSMSRREKTEFILEQVALCIEKGDWIQAGILSRKVSTRYFARKPKKTPDEIEAERKKREAKGVDKGTNEAPEELEDDVTDLKLRYYEQQITLSKHDDKYLDVCKHYRQVLDTEAVENNPDQLKAVRFTMCLPPRLSTDTNPGPRALHLLRPPRAPRQRTIRPPSPHPARLTQRPDPNRRSSHQALHRRRADALAFSVRQLRRSPDGDRRVRHDRERGRPASIQAVVRYPETRDRAQRARGRQVLHSDPLCAAHDAAGPERGRDGKVHFGAGRQQDGARQDRSTCSHRQFREEEGRGRGPERVERKHKVFAGSAGEDRPSHSKGGDDGCHTAGKQGGKGKGHRGALILLPDTLDQATVKDSYTKYNMKTIAVKSMLSFCYCE